MEWGRREHCVANSLSQFSRKFIKRLCDFIERVPENPTPPRHLCTSISRARVQNLLSPFSHRVTANCLPIQIQGVPVIEHRKVAENQHLAAESPKKSAGCKTFPRTLPRQQNARNGRRDESHRKLISGVAAGVRSSQSNHHLPHGTRGN